MVYETYAEALAIVRIVNARLGLPRRDDNTGPAVAMEFQQARGWTTSELTILRSYTSARACFNLTDDAYALRLLPGPPQLNFDNFLTDIPAEFLNPGVSL